MIFENTLKIGQGIYTRRDIADILRQPYQKVSRWINVYWDGKLGKEYNDCYSWRTDGSQAVSFHTLVEFYLMMLFGEAGVPPRRVMAAHKELSVMYDTAFPFAKREVLDNLHTDNQRIYFKTPDGDIVTLDGTRQLNLKFVKLFFKKLDFDQDNLASKFWPLGKNKAIVIDPARKFGHPVVNGHNVYPETLYGHHKAGDPIAYIAHVYQLQEKEVEDALEFCTAA